MLCLAQLLDSLEAFYGPQTPDWPSDPYRFLVWWHCGYPASDARCAKGWASLAARFSMDPHSLLAANPAKLSRLFVGEAAWTAIVQTHEAELRRLSVG